jgi:hypothetical protein
MEDVKLLLVAMAAKCRAVIKEADASDFDLPDALHPSHLLWMCDRIEGHAEDWPETKLHRWIGFIQCGLMANRMAGLDEVKAMFGEAKHAYGDGHADQDLLDHLDPASSFHVDVGGEA